MTASSFCVSERCGCVWFLLTWPSTVLHPQTVVCELPSFMDKEACVFLAAQPLVLQLDDAEAAPFASSSLLLFARLTTSVATATEGP